MPARSDKRDSLAFTAFLLGIQVEFIDGVDGSDVSLKEYPQVKLAWTIFAEYC